MCLVYKKKTIKNYFSFRNEMLDFCTRTFWLSLLKKFSLFLFCVFFFDWGSILLFFNLNSNVIQQTNKKKIEMKSKQKFFVNFKRLFHLRTVWFCHVKYGTNVQRVQLIHRLTLLNLIKIVLTILAIRV